MAGGTGGHFRKGSELPPLCLASRKRRFGQRPDRISMLSPARHISPGVVVTRTPLRVSFAGGGTDLAEFYERDYGAVFSTAIDKYIYVTVKRHSELFNEPIRIN